MNDSLPDKPDMVLRIGFAGTRNLSGNTSLLQGKIGEVLRAAAARLEELAACDPVDGQESVVRRYYSSRPPRLVLVAGLAEGADALAARALLDLREAGNGAHVQPQLGAVLPFAAESYRGSREGAFQDEFVDLLEKCAYVVEVDGRYEAGDENRPYRSRAYRAQAAVLLRQCDLFLAVTNPDEPGGAGGTLESVRTALSLSLPVILIDPTNPEQVCMLEPGGDPVSALASTGEASTVDWKKQLSGWIDSIVADPDLPTTGVEEPTEKPGKDGRTDEVGEFLEEFFSSRRIPPLDGADRRRRSVREKVWKMFEQIFRQGERRGLDLPLEPYATFRRRATNLNYHYGGLYRGAFLLNYLLAIFAVILATCGLLLLVLVGPTEHGPPSTGMQPAAAADSAITHAPPVHESPPAVGMSPRPGVLLLALLGLVKLILVVGIFWNTHLANRCRWSEKAVEYRYLAERLRGQFYLPRAGSIRVETLATPRYASRFVRQSASDWLIGAIIRSVSPVDLKQLQATMPEDRAKAPVLRLDPGFALQAVDENWIDGQIEYHEDNAETMRRMNDGTGRLSHILNFTVIGVVLVDLLILALDLKGLLPSRISAGAHALTPWLLFSAAILPAAVAGLGGIRFQAECHRLADRSRVMKKILESRKEETVRLRAEVESASRETDGGRGSWCAETLHLTEAVSRDMLHEVGDWSVFYAKVVEAP